MTFFKIFLFVCDKYTAGWGKKTEKLCYIAGISKLYGTESLFAATELWEQNTQNIS